MPDPSPPSLERLEEIVNWTLPGLTMYYRDANLSAEIIAKYEVGTIFRARTFVDVSSFAGKPTTNCRFIVASSKAAPLYRINPDTEKWGFHCINCNSYFKVLDVYEKAGVTQVFLLHIPYKGIAMFSSTVLRLGENNLEQDIIEKARVSLNQKLEGEVPTALNEKDWLHRTSFPIGLDTKNDFFPLEPQAPLFPMAIPMHTAIRKMTNDLTDLNEPPLPQTQPTAPKPSTPPTSPVSPANPPKRRSEKKGGFWSNLFGQK